MATTFEEVPQHRSARRRASSTTPVALISAGAALLAAAAPAGLTGSPGIDLVERALLAALVTYVGAHGHRRTFLIVGLVAAIPARGVSLVFVLVGLLAAALDAGNRRRSRISGAVVSAALVNAVLWYPGTGAWWLGPLVGTVVVLTLLASGSGELRHKPRRAIAITFALLGLVALLSVASTALGIVRARGNVEVGTAAARDALAAVQRGDAPAARRSLTQAQKHLKTAQTHLELATAPADLIPGMAQQVAAVRTAVREALTVTEAADGIVTIDYDDLRYEGRMDLEKMSELQPSADTVSTALDRADRELTETKGGWLAPPVRSRIEDLAGRVSDARSDAALARQLLDVTPGLLGGDGTRNYLAVFITPAELRGAGGFIGSFAELEANDGDVELVRSGRINDLIDATPPGIRHITGQPEYVRRWGRFNPQDFLQDTTFGLDWPGDAKVISQLYAQSGGRPVDGVIAVDPKGLAALLELTGPVAVEGIDAPLTSDNAVDFLTRDQYLEYGSRAERGEVLEAATRATFEKLTDASLPAPRTIGAALGPAVRGRHLQIWSPDPDESRLFRRIGAEGRVHVTRGQDALAVVQQNSGNNKIDAYQQREVAYDATVDAATGHIDATVRITLHNDVPGTDLPLAVVGNTRNLPLGTNLSFVNVMTPHAVRSATLDGEPISLTEDRESGLRTWETPVIPVPPGGSVTLVLHLSGGLDLRQGYAFTYLPQPVANPDRFTAEITARNGVFVHDGTESTTLTADEVAEEPVVIRSDMAR